MNRENGMRGTTEHCATYFSTFYEHFYNGKRALKKTVLEITQTKILKTFD
jgi:hypothetical protein